MQWKEQYENRLCSFEEAVKHIKSGDRIALGSACGTPEDLIDAMLEPFRGMMKMVKLSPVPVRAMSHPKYWARTARVQCAVS